MSGTRRYLTIGLIAAALFSPTPAMAQETVAQNPGDSCALLACDNNPGVWEGIKLVAPWF